MPSLTLPQSYDRLLRFLFYGLIVFLPYCPIVVEMCVLVSLMVWLCKRAWVVKNFFLIPSLINKPVFIFILSSILVGLSGILMNRVSSVFFMQLLSWCVIYFLVIEVFQRREQVYIALGLFIVTTLVSALCRIVHFYFTSKILSGLNEAGVLILGIPLVFALIFMKNKKLRYRFLTTGFLSFFVWALALIPLRFSWLAAMIGGGLVFLVVATSYKLIDQFKIFFIKDSHLMIVSIGLWAGICAFLIYSFSGTNFYLRQFPIYFWLKLGLQGAILNLIREAS